VERGIQVANGYPFLALTQGFEKEAPILTKFVVQLAGLFEILPGQKEVTIRGTSRNAASKCLASYFIAGEEIYAISLATGKILKFTGRQEGGSSLGDNREILVGLNIEYEVLPENMIHEIIHAKWPKEIPQEKIHHEMIDEMANEIRKRLDLHLKAPVSEIAVLKREQSQILRTFKNFDKALGKIIFPREKTE
jgi:hypothetical protein